MREVRPVPCEFYTLWPDSTTAQEWGAPCRVTAPARIPIRYCIGRISLTQMIPRLETHKADDPTGFIAAHGESRNEKKQKSSARHGRQCSVQFAEQLMGCDT